MEYADGADLRSILRHYRETKKHVLPLPVACSILGDMATGLNFAHFERDIGKVPLGLVHRDVKPANTLVTYGGYAKLLDFGISTTREDERTGRFQYGTPRYMSQEHFYCKVDPSMDVYSLGVVAWEMLEGRTFRDGQPGFNGDFTWAVINLDPPRVTKKGLPPDIVGIVEASLAASARPSAEEFAAVVSRYAKGREGQVLVKAMVRSVLGRGERSAHTGYLEVPLALRGEEEGVSSEPPDREPKTESPDLEETSEDDVTVVRLAELSDPTTVRASPAAKEPDAPSFIRRKQGDAQPTVDDTVLLPSSGGAVSHGGWSVRASSVDTELVPPPRETPARVSTMALSERAQTRVFTASVGDEPSHGGQASGRRRTVLLFVVGVLLSSSAAFAVGYWLIGGSS